MNEFTDLIFTLMGYTGRWLNAKKKRICFIIWCFCVVYWCLRNMQLGLKVQSVACLITLGLNIYGFINWKK